MSAAWADVHQARVIAAPFQHLGNDGFLADMALGDVFHLEARARPVFATRPAPDGDTRSG